MRTLRGSFADWEPLPGPTAVAIGVFDGMHRGHQAILQRLHERAGDAEIGVVTFAAHPATVLRPESAPVMLTSLEQRLEHFAASGVGVAAVLEFDEVRTMTPQAFVAEIVVGVMRASRVAVGSAFRFGHNMAGDVARLAELGDDYGFALDIVPIVGGNQPVRSTAIRDALAAGDLEAVTSMLGRRFELRGSVVAGAARGRDLGFPTANLDIAGDRAVPAYGVYSAWAGIGDGTWHPGVVNVGVRPTFGGEREVVEVHLLDGERDLYGQELRVEFVSPIRGERRFAGVGELVEQVAKDVVTAQEQLAIAQRD